MKPNTPPRRCSFPTGALTLSLAGGLALAGCAGTTSLSNEHEPRTDAPQSELERRVTTRPQGAMNAERTLDDAPRQYAVRYIRPSPIRPGPAGTPVQPSTRPNTAPPGFYPEDGQVFPPGCECSVSAATLDVAIPCGQSACVNEKLFSCVGDEKVEKSDACSPVSTCQCAVDTDGAGPKGFAMECETSICFEGRLTSCDAGGQVTRGETCGS